MKLRYAGTVLLSCALLWGAAQRGAVAQEFPTGQTITIVVGFVAGGATDTSTRIIAKELSSNLGQPVVVENRPGAGSILAAQYVVNAKADGTVLMLGSIGPIAVMPHLMKLSFDPLRDLAPITMGVSFPNVLVVPPSLNITTLAEFVGSVAMIDLLGGRIEAYYSTPSSAASHIQNKKLVAIATTGLTRPDSLAGLPTIAESGYPDFNATNWYAYLAPAKTPAPILERWNTEFVKVLTTPSVREALLAHGLMPDPMSRQALADYMAKESAIWKTVIQERNIKID